MKTKVNLKRIVAYTIILTTLSTLPVYAAEDVDTNKVTIEYNDIEKIVKNDNRQLSIIKDSIIELEDARDASRDALRQAIEMQENINEPIDSQMYNPITNGQIESSRLNLEQAEINMVNSTKEMFIILHQLSYNIEQLKENNDLMLQQLEVTKVRSNLGLVTQSVVTDMESSLIELDASYSSLVKQLDELLIQFKGFLNVPLNKAIELGDIPYVDEDYLKEMNFEDDIKLAKANSLSLKIKRQELSNNKASSKIRKNEIKLKENEIELGITKQYNLLLETMDTLKISENKLNSLNAKLEKEQLRYEMGLISLMDLKSTINEVQAQENTVKTNSSNLFIEVENYEAMKNGMI